MTKSPDIARITVLFTIDPPPELRAHLTQALAGEPVELLFADRDDEARLTELAPRADVMVGWRVSGAVLQAAVRLRQYIFAGVGAQSVLSELRDLAARQPVTLLKSIANTYATGQHAVALLLALTNKIIPHHNWMAAGHWRRGDDWAQSTTLRHRQVGLLGYGAVNRHVHRFLAGFEVGFAICKRSWEDAAELALPTDVARFSESELTAFLDAVDILLVGLPLTTRTRGMLGAGELQRLGAGGLLVNVARGAVIDEAALYQALRDEVIAGAALDVWYDYRPDPDDAERRYPYSPEHPFHALDNVVLSPHRAASPVFDLGRWDEVADHLRRFIHDEPPLNVVDLEREY